MLSVTHGLKASAEELKPGVKNAAKILRFLKGRKVTALVPALPLVTDIEQS